MLVKRIHTFIGVGVFLLLGTSSLSADPPPGQSKIAREFWKTLERELGQQWYIAAEANVRKLSTADIRVYFHVTADRRLEVVRVFPQNPNDPLAKMTLNVFAGMTSPPIPQELLSSPDKLYDDIGFQFRIR